MNSLDYIEEIKLKLTGDLLETEISDETLKKILDSSVREVNRYYNSTRLLEIPGQSYTDLNKFPEVLTVVNVFRPTGVGSIDTESPSKVDPAYMSQLQMFHTGNVYHNSQEWLNKFAIYSTSQQISNTLSTDLAFRVDELNNSLYVNLPQGVPEKLTIEYIPRLRDASEVKGVYWEDVLLRLALAQTKITLGRIRTRFTQSNAMWSSDGETLLEEGKTELAELRETLQNSNDYFAVVD